LKKHECADASGAKKIAVVDESGKCYEATYLKRAKGLVKHGRARFIDENTICLACPPDNLKYTEDNSMTNTENINVNLETGEVIIPEAEELYKCIVSPSYPIRRINITCNNVLPDDCGKQITMFESVGISVEDIAAAKMIYQYAKENNIGTWLEI
jgi:hypothetical protein